MKTRVIIILLLYSGLAWGQPELHWKFENAIDYVEGNHCCFKFDVAVSSTVSGTYLNGANLFLRYNPDSFFPHYAGSGLLTVEPQNFLTQQVFGTPMYQINDAMDYAPDILNFSIISNYPVANPMFEGLIPVFPNYITLFKINMIFYQGQAGIEFVDSLMNGQQFYMASWNPQPTPFGIPPVYAGIYDNDLFNYQLISDHIYELDMKVILEGVYDQTSNMMSTLLVENNYVPHYHPFNPTLPYYNNNNPCWFYPFTGPYGNLQPNTVDWIMLEQRDTYEITEVEGMLVRKRMPLLLPSDGTCAVDLSPFCKNLFIVVYHRNHLPVVNALPMQPYMKNSDCWWYNYDFTTGPDKAYGGTSAVKELEPGVWGMIAGDGNADKNVNNLDKIMVWNVDLGNSGYLGGDFNLDGQCNNSDKIIYWYPNAGHSAQLP